MSFFILYLLINYMSFLMIKMEKQHAQEFIDKILSLVERDDPLKAEFYDYERLNKIELLEEILESFKEADFLKDK